MFVDASAIVAVVAPEDDGPLFAARLEVATRVQTSALAVYEAVLGISRRREVSVSDAEYAVSTFLTNCRAEIVPITPEIGHSALAAFARYGRGQHPARFNMGDCFAYACARTLGVPLLYKGDDFAQTDVALG